MVNARHANHMILDAFRATKVHVRNVLMDTSSTLVCPSRRLLDQILTALNVHRKTFHFAMNATQQALPVSNVQLDTLRKITNVHCVHLFFQTV